jgi:glycolate oxidase iron-sulfur subunit
MRLAQESGHPLDRRLAEVIDSCVGCRGCETACPSGVPFGRLLEGTRRSLAAAGHGPPRWLRAALAVASRPRLLKPATSLLAVAQRLGVASGALPGLPRLPVRPRPLAATGDDAWLHPGCVMDAWLRPQHRAAMVALAATGVGVRLPDHSRCCGALHLHAGLHDRGAALARSTIAAFAADDAPVIVDSAGCGAAMKEYGHLLGTDAARSFSSRVRDVHEVLADAVVDGRLQVARRLPITVAVQDPCHLRHAQRVHGAVRIVLEAVVERVVELDDEGLCCGAGGAYAATHKQTATAIRELKLAAIERSGAQVIASANPGCWLHLRATGLDVRHPVELVAEAVVRDEEGADGR